MAKIADKVTRFDGQIYQPGEEIWDLGSFECVAVDGNKRSYEGFSADIAKLPKYDDLGAGSTALCLDDGTFLKYHAKTKTWNLL